MIHLSRDWGYRTFHQSHSVAVTPPRRDGEVELSSRVTERSAGILGLVARRGNRAAGRCLADKCPSSIGVLVLQEMADRLVHEGVSFQLAPHHVDAARA